MITVLPTTTRGAFNSLMGGILSESSDDLTMRQSIDWDVSRFEESGNANVLDPRAQAAIQGRLMSVPGAQRWTDSRPTTASPSYARGYASWQNLWNRVVYRINDAAPSAAAFSAATAPSWNPVLATALGPLGRALAPTPSAVVATSDSLLGRSRTNAILYTTPPQGENPADPANRGKVDELGESIGKIVDTAGAWLPWLALGAAALAVVVIVIAVKR